jgi:hypothetical protein
MTMLIEVFRAAGYRLKSCEHLQDLRGLAGTFK